MVHFPFFIKATSECLKFTVVFLLLLELLLDLVCFSRTGKTYMHPIFGDIGYILEYLSEVTDEREGR